MIAFVLQSRLVLWNLSLREVRVRYKQSFMGVAWALLVPSAMMIIFTFVFARVTRITETLAIDMPYALFAYIGLLPWAFFSQSLTQATQASVSNQGLVTKIYFPRQVLPISSVISSMFDFLIASIVLIGLMAYFHLAGDWSFRPSWTLLWLPCVLSVQLILTIGLALWFSMGNLFYRDVKYLVAVGLQLWMFMTSVIYPLKTSNPRLQLLIHINPMTPIIDAYRRILVHSAAPEIGPLLLATTVSCVVLATGWIMFEKVEPRFAERV